MTQTLDISGGVSEEQYRTVLEKLLDAFEMCGRTTTGAPTCT